MSAVGGRLGWAVLVAFAACQPGASAGGGAGAPVTTDHVMLPPSYLFKPAAIVVTVGTRVGWTNTDHFTHSVQLLDDGGNGGGKLVGILKPGDSTSYTFTTVGTYRYQCSFHPRDMHGVVFVKAG